MTSIAQKLTHDALALSEAERMEIFIQLANSLPAEKTIIAESARRAEEMKNGGIIAMTDTQFRNKMNRFKQQFHKQA